MDTTYEIPFNEYDLRSSSDRRCLGCNVPDAWDGDRWVGPFCVECAKRWPDPIREAAEDAAAVDRGEQPTGNRYTLRTPGAEPVEFTAAYIEGDWVRIIGSHGATCIARSFIISASRRSPR